MTKNINHSNQNILKGMELKVFNSGIKKFGSDLLYITFPKNSSVAGVFTKSKTPSAAVSDCIKKINSSDFKRPSIKCLIVNSGNANAFTGKNGEKTVSKIVNFISKKVHCKKREVFTASTGVIGEFLDQDKIISSISKNNPTSINSFVEASKSIMTTDTFYKVAFSKIQYKDFIVNLVGIAKGSGMISPNMGTMLAFMFTDLNIQSDVLQKILIQENEQSFNSITVDSDTSTSDTCLLISTNKLKNKKVTAVHEADLLHFKKGVSCMMLNLAKQIVIDGEGATKIIKITINEAKTASSAKKIGMSIGNSPLVKTAIAGEDANWGRIVMAIGKANEKINVNKIKIYYGDQLVACNGMRHDKYNEVKLNDYLKNKEIEINVSLGIGKFSWTIYTCDLTEKYIKINADYRT